MWQNHPLGFQLVKKVFNKFQQDKDFIQTCMLAALLLEYELRVIKYVEKELQRKTIESNKKLPDILVKYKASKL